MVDTLAKDSPKRDMPEGILAVRAGRGANCSSIGSAVEMLFLSATVGAAILAAVSAALDPEADAQDTKNEIDQQKTNQSDDAKS
jgi:hypothetical protein